MRGASSGPEVIVVAGPPAHDSDPPGSETGIEGGKTIERPPLRMGEGFGALGRCAVRTAGLIATRRLHEPRTNVGRRVRWADGSTAAVYRETVADVTPTDTPTTLVVSFRPRGVRSERPPPPVPARERAQHDPVRGVPRVRVEAVVRERTARASTEGCTTGATPPRPRRTSARCAGP